MANEKSRGRSGADENLDIPKPVETSTLGPDGIASHSVTELLRKNAKKFERDMKPSLDALEKYAAPVRQLQERMRSLGIAAGQESDLKRLADKIAGQQIAIDAIRLPKPEMPHIPDLESIPPNPIHQTNRRLERIEERVEEMQGVAANSAEIANGLQGAAAEFLQKFESAAENNDRAAKRAIRIGIIALIIALAMPAAQIFYSEYRREPNNGAEEQAALEVVQAELAAMRAEQAAASKRLNEVLAKSGEETAVILREIHVLLSRDAARSPAPGSE
ncbi:hypothetical protein [Pyruvatibacter mobilis]|uniref:hypothetical protein n=1 Tax=Pyruvatibacter mobilis TaxID=1712261 RepID=UPI003D0C174A